MEAQFHLRLASILYGEVCETETSGFCRKVGELHGVVTFQHDLRLTDDTHGNQSNASQLELLPHINY